MKPSDKIWLKPECDKCDERCWSCAPFDDCEECGKEATGYVRDDIVLASTAEASRMFDRIEKLEAALRNISEGDISRTVKIPFRDDGKSSKHDRCEHGQWFYEDCGCCIEDYARKALEGKDD